MQIVILLSIVFIGCFLLFFRLVSKGNKQESDDKKLGYWGLFLVVFIMTLIPVVLIAIITFVLLGSTNVINLIFSLDIGTKQIIILAVVLLVYLFSLDNLFEIFAKLIIGSDFLNILFMLFIRIFVFYFITLMVGLDQTRGMVMAAGVAVMIALLEFVYFLRKKERNH